MSQEALLKKLRIKAGTDVLIMDLPEGTLDTSPSAWPEGVNLYMASEEEKLFDAVLLFVRDKASLRANASDAITHSKPDGVLWIAYPKKSGRIKSDLTRDIGWEPVFEAGWEPVTQAAVTDDWSALRFKPADMTNLRHVERPDQMKFTAELIKDDQTDGTGVQIPFSVKEVYGTGGMFRVRGYLDGKPFAGTLAPMGKGVHFLGIRKEVKEALGKTWGDTIQVTIEPDSKERTVEVPEDFMEALEDKPAALAFFDGLSYTYRKEYVDWVTSAKKEETRLSRIGKAVELLAEGKKTR